MDDDREAYEFSHALYLARQVDREMAQMIVQAAEAGVIQLSCATDLLMQLSRHTSKGYLSGGYTNGANRRKLSPKKDVNLPKDGYANQRKNLPSAGSQEG